MRLDQRVKRLEGHGDTAYNRRLAAMTDDELLDECKKQFGLSGDYTPEDILDIARQNGLLDE